MSSVEELWERMRQWSREHPIKPKVIMVTLPRRSPPTVMSSLTDGIYPCRNLEFIVNKERKSKPEDSKYIFDPNGFQKLLEESNTDNKEKK